MKTKAFLFDLDGTLIDTMPWHFKTWQLVVSEMGSPLQGDALMKELYGNGAELMNRLIPGRTFTEEEAKAIVDAKEERYRQLYGKQITVLEGAREFLEEAFKLQIPMGIGTASNQANIDFALDQLQIRSYFTGIVGADDVSDRLSRVGELKKVGLTECSISSVDPHLLSVQCPSMYICDE